MNNYNTQENFVPEGGRQNGFVQNGSASGEFDEDIFQMLITAWNRYIRPYFWLYPLSVFCFLIAGYIFLQTAVPRYRSTCQLHINRNQANIMNLKGIEDPSYLNATDSFINTQIMLLKSREITEAAFSKMSFKGDSEACSKPDIKIVRGTTLVEVTVSSPDKYDAAGLANAIADAYLEKVNLRKVTLSSTGSDLLRDQLVVVQKKYDAAVQDLVTFKERNGVFDFQVAYNNLVNRMNELNKFSFDAKLNLDETELALQGIRENRANAVVMLPYLLKDAGTENLSTLQNMLLTHEMGLPQLMVKYNEGHQIVKIHNTVGKMIRKAQEEEIEISLKGLELKKIRLQKQIARYEEQLKEINLKISELDKLGGEYSLLENSCNSLDNTIKMLVRRINELQVTDAGNKLDNFSIFVAERAQAAEKAYFPVPLIVFALMFILGLGVAGGAAFALTALNNKVTEIEMVNTLLGRNLPVFGMLPQFRNTENELLKSSGNDVIDETFRDIRTSLNLSMVTRKTRVLAVTSSLPDEGKTFTACNLARSFARDHKKILLMDLDMRRPRLDKILAEFLHGRKITRGISNVLVGDCSIQDAVINIPDLNLDVVFAGPIPPNPSELLSSGCLGEVLEKAKEEYDLVVLDTPPIILVSDTLIIGGYQVPLLLISRLYLLPKAAILHLRRKLSQLNINLAGLIGNNVDVPKSVYGNLSKYGYYNYSGKSGSLYHYGYGKRENDKTDQK